MATIAEVKALLAAGGDPRTVLDQLGVLLADLPESTEAKPAGRKSRRGKGAAEGADAPRRGRSK